ncbi:hypothetical protein HNQ80_002826 [Anaerosolibacter carboniphilus]|uniref:DUF4230 domain-containing protein n=1 Tax=Anaerosolibacter carboniphilus TaxID=1417629 RepID=A0A841L0M3_9FIRM|nr:DUF4230 domain-containing protein [Anaerosolibacter carboniphilus]MBB6216722.1 hypothetical protein [Anaerosolibacter carboniphilus]
MKTRRMGMLIALLVIIVLQISWMYTSLGFKNQTSTNVSSVLEQIKPISELNTVEMYFHDIVDYEDAKYFHEVELPFTKKKFIFTVRAKVKAGINLNKINTEDIQIVDKKTIKIKLPTAEITSKEILEYKAYDEKDSLFNDIKNEDTFHALEAFEKDLEQQAIEMGILEKAVENAKLSIRQFLKGAGYEEVIFE